MTDQPQYTPEEATALAGAQLAAQAAASAQPVAPPTPEGQALADAGARPVAVDTDALLKQLQALTDRVNASLPVPPPDKPPARTSDLVDATAPGWAHYVVGALEDRLEAVEAKLGLRDGAS